MRQCEDQNGEVSATSTSTSSSSNFFNSIFMASSSSSPSSSSLQFRNAHNLHEEGNHHHEETSAENRSSLGNIEVVVIQNHVNLKVQCQRRPGQLLKAIVALEDLRLSVLHLNITSLHSFVFYSFNLKVHLISPLLIINFLVYVDSLKNNLIKYLIFEGFFPQKNLANVGKVTSFLKEIIWDLYFFLTS